MAAARKGRRSSSNARARTNNELIVGAFEASLRESALARYVEAVRDRSYQLTDDDVESLRALGLDDDLILDLTIASVLGAEHRLREANRVVIEHRER